ncbi:hypothetical protein [Antarcticimicrobium sediminis]|nr:hypothetical protein [Antarcticimicrobium sediminis]
MLIDFHKHRGDTIQSRLRRSVIEALHSGQMTDGQRMLPSRQLAEQL